MLGILKTIFGGGDIIKSGFDLIDSMHTSETEKIEAQVKGKVDMLNAYAPFKIAQRLLAMLFSVTFLSCFVLVLIMTLKGQANIDDVRAVISEFYIGEIMLAIIMFYFGGGFLEGTIKRAKDKQ